MAAILRLVSDNPTPDRAALIEDAVRAAAHACFPWGVQNLGMAQVLQKILWTQHGVPLFVGEVLIAWRVQNDWNETASTPRGLA